MAAEELHLGRAAERLHIVQPALSRQIAALEKEIGFQLFLRSKGRLTLTAAGTVFHGRAKTILNSVDAATHEGRLVAEGEVAMLQVGFVGAAMWSLLPQALREHRRRFPGVHFQLHELLPAAQVRRLLDGSLDIGLLRPPVPEEIAVETLWSEDLVLVVPDDHPVAGEAAVDLAEMADETFILASPTESPELHRRTLEVCRSYGFIPSRNEVSDTGSTGLHLVAAGMAVSLVPRSLAHQPWPGVSFKELSGPTVQIELQLAYVPARAGDATQMFVETLRSAASGVLERDVIDR